MDKNAYIDYLSTCLAFLDADLKAEEAVVQIEQGLTLYSSNARLIYLVRIATFENMTGNMPTNTRSCVIQVTSNSPHEAAYAQMSDWEPL